MTGLKMAENFPSQGKKMTLPIIKLHNQHHANSISRLVGKKLLCQLKSESLNCTTLLSQGCKLSKTNIQSQRKNIFRPRDRKLHNQHHSSTIAQLVGNEVVVSTTLFQKSEMDLFCNHHFVFKTPTWIINQNSIKSMAKVFSKFKMHRKYKY